MPAYDPYAFEDLTVGNAAGGVGAPNLNPNLRRARITCNAQAIRYRYDGGDPTASLGHRLAPEETVVLEGYKAISQLKMIREGGSDANVFITYEM